MDLSPLVRNERSDGLPCPRIGGTRFCLWLLAGVLSAVWGPQEAIIVSGAIFGLIGVGCVLFLKPVRQLA